MVGMGTWDGEAADTGMPQASVVPVAPTVAAPPVGAVRKSDFTSSSSFSSFSFFAYMLPLFGGGSTVGALKTRV